jgi:hypothetical protein
MDCPLQEQSSTSLRMILPWVKGQMRDKMFLRRTGYFMTISQLCDRLRIEGIEGVDSYQQKLRDNERDKERLQDLACEGYVAFGFSKVGWAVTMRDSPDLEARLDGIYLGIEVKHFRYKEAHDPIEDAALKSGGQTLALIPFLSETEVPRRCLGSDVPIRDEERTPICGW